MTHDTLASEASTALPRNELDVLLRESVQIKLKDELLNSLRLIESTLRCSLKPLEDLALGLQTCHSFSPELFMCMSEIQESIRLQDVGIILDSIQNLHMCLQRQKHAPNKLTVSSILTEYWEHRYVDILRSYDQKNLIGETSLVRPVIDDEEMEKHRFAIDAALSLIQKFDPEIYAEIQVLCCQIKIFQGRVLRGDTSQKTWGAMWLRVPEPEDDQVGYWIEHIVHEISHLKLHGLYFHEKYVLNPDSELKFKAPIRDDLRPMFGIFHACFVLARMKRVFRRLSIGGYEKRFRDRLQLCSLQFEIGMQSIYHPDGNFSSNGKKIIESLMPCSMS